MSNSLLLKVYPKVSVNRINKKIELLGVDGKITLISFLNMRIISLLIFMLLLYILFQLNLVIIVLLGIIFYILFEYFVLDKVIKKREKKLNNEGLFFFEILSLSLESGRNLKGALEITCNSLDTSLSREFKSALKNMSYGKSLEECLKSIKSRIPSNSINEVILNITESNINGSKIVNVLDRQVEYLRDKKVLNIRGEINKMPLKISVISVLIFVPLLLLMLLSPVLLNYLM